MHIDKKNAKQIIFISCSIILFYLGVKNFNIVLGVLSTIVGYISPFLIGLGIAFIFNIPMTFVEKWLTKLFTKRKSKKKKHQSGKWIRPTSIFLTLLLFIGTIFIVMFIVIPEIGRTIKSINTMLPGFIKRMDKWIQYYDQQMPQIIDQIESMGISLGDLNQKLISFMQNIGLQIVNSSFTILGSMFSSLLKFFLGLIFSFYVLANKEKLTAQAKSILHAFLPSNQSKKIVKIVAMTNKTFINFFTGQFTEALILGGMFWVGMTIFRFPYAMMISVLVAFTALIPVFGAFIGCTVGAFLILVSNPMQAIWFIVFFLVIQQIEGNLIYPKVVGSSVGLPAIWVLVAVTVGGSMMGVVGMLIFIPIASVIYNLLKESVHKRLKEKKSHGANKLNKKHNSDTVHVDE